MQRTLASSSLAKLMYGALVDLFRLVLSMTTLRLLNRWPRAAERHFAAVLSVSCNTSVKEG